MWSQHGCVGRIAPGSAVALTAYVTTRFVRVVAVAAALVALGSVFIAFVRPWYLDWGATADEQRKSLPGDEILPGPATQQTRSIPIRAPVEAVWPWLAQIGQDRGGFYSFDLLENLVGCDMPTTDVLRPERQAWYPYQHLWMYPPSGVNAIGFATLRALVPGRALGFGTRAVGTDVLEPEDGSWSFVLEPQPDGTTRLLIRGRGVARRSWFGVAFDRGIFEPMHFAMERRMMIGLKDVVETGTRSPRLNHLHIVLWTFVFGVFVIALVRTLVVKAWGRDLALAVAAAIVFQVLTLRQPSTLVGVPLTILLVALLARRYVVRQRPS